MLAAYPPEDTSCCTGLIRARLHGHTPHLCRNCKPSIGKAATLQGVMCTHRRVVTLRWCSRAHQFALTGRQSWGCCLFRNLDQIVVREKSLVLDAKP
ncbi:unnamed protein product [Urochloa humidicola]